jgi:hypothetical protein
LSLTLSQRQLMCIFRGRHGDKMLDVDILLSHLDHFAGNQILSTQHRATLQSSLVVLKHQMHLDHVIFWGRIHGIESDYFIVQGIEKSNVKNAYFNRRILFSQVHGLSIGLNRF